MADAGLLFFLLGTCFLLGMFHGVVPDEHTWPITFAYSVGSTTGRGGLKSAAWFSLAFTLQRALMSMLVFFAFYFALFAVQTDQLNAPVYFFVGVAMAVAGIFLLRRRYGQHFHPFMRASQADLARHVNADGTPKGGKPVPLHWCFIHGFISGFGVDTGVLSTFIYVTTIPVLAAAGLWQIGWLPGALFGAGTFVVLMVVGLFFGGALQLGKRLGAHRIDAFGQLVGARVLFYGGLAFIVLAPLYYYGLAQSLPVDTGTLIVLLVLVAIALPVMFLTWREVRKMPDLPSPSVAKSSGPSSNP